MIKQVEQRFAERQQPRVSEEVKNIYEEIKEPVIYQAKQRSTIKYEPPSYIPSSISPTKR